jgi:hypothetical protein
MQTGISPAATLRRELHQAAAAASPGGATV